MKEPYLPKGKTGRGSGQEPFGWLSPEARRILAAYLDIAPAQEPETHRIPYSIGRNYIEPNFELPHLLRNKVTEIPRASPREARWWEGEGKYFYPNPTLGKYFYPEPTSTRNYPHAQSDVPLVDRVIQQVGISFTDDFYRREAAVLIAQAQRDPNFGKYKRQELQERLAAIAGEHFDTRVTGYLAALVGLGPIFSERQRQETSDSSYNIKGRDRVLDEVSNNLRKESPLVALFRYIIKGTGIRSTYVTNVVATAKQQLKR